TDVEHVHVGVIEILTAHGPDEGVVAGTAAHVNGPWRRNDGFRIAHDDVAHRVRLAHEVEHPVVFTQVEIEVCFRAAVVKMRGHRVPDAARLQHRKPQQELGRAAGLRHDVLVDHAIV